MHTISGLVGKTWWCLLILCADIPVLASPLFDDNTILDVELVGPIGSLIKDKNDEIELPFVLKADGIEHQLKVRARGNSRLRVCEFPPLRFNFSRSARDESVFAGQDKLKLVTHCRNREAAQTDALQEYATYRIFNRISDIGYKVRLLRITYTDTDNRFSPKLDEHYAFLIESQIGLAARVGGEPANVTGISLKSLDDDHTALVYVFQYLVGNTDWSFVMAEGDDECCHNGDIIAIGSSRFYVPYDFDLAGLVNAKYAYPDPSLRIRKVTQRLYRGFCTERGTLQSALATVKGHQSDIINVLTEIPGISDKDRRQSIDYLGQFFVKAADEAKLIGTFEKRCL